MSTSWRQWIAIVFLWGINAFAMTESGVDLKVTRKVLDNGLTILFHENQQAPTVACRLFYATGSVHEKAGQTGLAHMLEHMLFKGTQKVGIQDSVLDAQYIRIQDSLQALMREALLRQDSVRFNELQKHFNAVVEKHREIMVKNELWETYLKAGGTGLNAYTTDLVTAYFVTLPRNKIELFLWLESDRMQNAVLREFYSERDVVREERRLRYDDRPTGRYFESLDAIFYENFPYRIPTIGYPSDIEHLTREMAQEHYDKYYKPNNAILVFAGDFKTDSLYPLVERYFASIPRGEEFQPITMKEPEQAGEKRLITRRNDAKPRVNLMFHTPAVGDPDIYALDIIESVLNGRSGRLTRRLVEQEKVAVNADAGNYARMYTGTFEIEAVLTPEADPTAVENIIWEELKNLQETPVSPRDLQKVRNLFLASKVRSLQNMENVASMLAYYELYGDWTLVNRWMEEVAKITPEQVQDVARRLFKRDLATVGWLIPEDAQ